MSVLARAKPPRRTRAPNRRTRPPRSAWLLPGLLAWVLSSCASPLAGDPPGPTPPTPEPPDPITEPPPPEWRGDDVGIVALAGDSDIGLDGVIRVRASGVDVWGTADGFHFTHRQLAGDGDLIVRVDEIEAAHEWSKAGIMVREDLTAGARNVFLHLTESNGAILQRRAHVDGTTTDIADDGTYFRAFEARAPAWLRLERRGDLWRYGLSPISGKKHQLRLHMATLGAGICNDPFYPELLERSEREADDYARPLKLLARGLRFSDPLSGALREFESTLQLDW